MSRERKTFSHVFRFEERQVEAWVIACFHDSGRDARYIKNHLSRIGDYSKVLFVEQGSKYREDSGYQVLKRLAQRNPTIAADFERSLKGEGFGGVSFGGDLLHEPNYYSKVQGPFAEAADFWLARGGRVVNMDCNSNYSTAALDYLAKAISTDFVMEVLYWKLSRACSSPEATMPLIIKEMLPQIPEEYVEECCGRFHDIYDRQFTPKDPLLEKMMARIVNLEKQIGGYDGGNSSLPSVRDRYMSKVIRAQLQDGDILLAHPVHINHILKLTG